MCANLKTAPFIQSIQSDIKICQLLWLNLLPFPILGLLKPFPLLCPHKVGHFALLQCVQKQHSPLSAAKLSAKCNPRFLCKKFRIFQKCKYILCSADSAPFRNKYECLVVSFLQLTV